MPSLEDESSIEDMYLFYDDTDLIDTYYTIYLNCEYRAEEYKNEEKRIKELFFDEDLLVENSDSFDYASLMYSNILEYDSFGLGLMSYQYVLFIENENRIVYITFLTRI